MIKKVIYTVLFTAFMASCSSKEDIIPASKTLTAFQEETITYFKEIALGFEFGSASAITRNWSENMKIYVGGDKRDYLLNEIEMVSNEINTLAENGFQISTVSDSSQSNFYIFFGTGEAYGNIFPSSKNLISSNWGLFNVSYNGQNHIFSGRMYVDTERPNNSEQRHLLREELTQALGLAKDSGRYPQSIFQQSWTRTTEYIGIDKELIRLLYHPQMETGLDGDEVEKTLAAIYTTENNE